MPHRVMLDLETLATTPDAAVASIGAIDFTPGVDMDAPGKSIHIVLDLEDQERRGRRFGANTVRWWLQQSEAARVIFKPGVTVMRLDDGLRAFSEWLRNAGPPGKVEVWGNGADFDNVILGSLYRSAGFVMPWSFSMNRCYRTLKNLGLRLGQGEGFERAGTAHNALDDARHQALYARAWLSKIPGAKSDG